MLNYRYLKAYFPWPGAAFSFSVAPSCLFLQVSSSFRTGVTAAVVMVVVATVVGIALTGEKAGDRASLDGFETFGSM